MKALVDISRNNWLQKIPTKWEIFRIKNLFQLSQEKNQGEDLPVLSLAQSGIRTRDISTNEGQLAESYENYTRIRPDDLVFNPMDLRSGAIDLSTYDGVVSLAYSVLRKRSSVNIHLKYFKYYFQWHYLDEIFFPFGQGVSADHRWTLKDNILLNFPVLFPPLETQKRIVDFLDEKTEVIDELVAKKEKLIELLREKRAALITHAVTKGLDPNAKLKSSGIYWLGDIPEGWEVRRLRTLGIFSASGIDKKTVAGEEVVKMVNYTNVYGNKNFAISIQTKLMETTAPKFKVKEHSLHAGDILFTPSSETEKDIGVSATVLEDIPRVVYSYHLIRFRPRKGYLDIRYTKYFANSAWTLSQFSALCKGTTRQILTRDSFNSVCVVISPLEIQRQIADFLDAEIAKIDKATALIESQIEKLKEYRSSLIYHAVTGKIKV